MIVSNSQGSLEGTRNGNVRDGQLLTEELGEFGKEKHPVREFTYLKDAYYARVKTILVGDRLYQILVGSSNPQELTSESVNTFLNSFTLEPTAVAAFNKERTDREARRQAQLDDFLAGRGEPKPAAEAITVAKYSKAKSQFAAAVRLYDLAFTSDPKLADDMPAQHRYSVACYAARAARGDGVDAPTDPKERAALRAKALAWLQADLAVRKKQAASTDPAERKIAVAQITHWLKDTDLTETRAGAKRDGWTPEDVKAWDAFWADVKATQEAAQKPPPPREVAPPPQADK
jgi:hypothetical protein